jgi:sugar phosphate isomerase/epimerase
MGEEMILTLNTWAVNAGMDAESTVKVFDDLERVFDDNEVPPGRRAVQTFAGPDFGLADKVRTEAGNHNIRYVIGTGFRPNSHEITVADGYDAAVAEINVLAAWTLQATPEGTDAIISGPTHAAWGKNLVGGHMYDSKSQELFVRGMKEVAQANPRVNFALEILNRGESYVLTTSEEGIYLLEQVNEPNVGFNYDVIHVARMKGAKNVLPDLKAVIASGIPIYDVHFCEDDRLEWGRGAMGAMQQDFLAELAASGYNRGVLPELFEPGLDEVVGIANPRDGSQQDFKAVMNRSAAYLWKDLNK